ncbi:MAG: hypothetical protein OSA08_14760, partial [Arenicellales bacterium]|nr:hypothetical protein [Arenicellales bacterium]
MVTFPNKKHRLLMVKLKYPFSRSITSLLSLTLVSAVLMLGSPAFAHELSGSTCGADVVFLWNQDSFRNCSTIKSYKRPGSNAGHCIPRPPLLYGHTRAVINTLAATGADVRFGTADQGFDPALMLAAGSYGNVGTEYLGSTPGYDDKGVYGKLRLGAFSDSTRVSRERIAHDEEIEQQLFAAQTRDSLVFRYHNPKGLSAAEHNTAAKNAVGKFGKPDHTFGDQSRGGYNSHHQLDNRPPNAEGVAKDTRTFTENVFGRMGPNGIAFDSKGNAYVLNAGRNEVYKMSHLGAVMAKWGGHGSGPGQFAHMAAHGGMMGIAIGPKHNVFIT